MSYFAARERERLCDTALAAGAGQATLCEGWSVRDLVAHLLVREGSPTAVGLALRPLSRLTEAARRRRARDDFSRMVRRLREGPPAYSPMALPAVDRRANALEFFVHHEDVRRARPGWEPRELPDREQDVLWRALLPVRRALSRRAAVGLVLERSDTGEQVRTSGDTAVTVSGLPSELVLFLYGRQAHARVRLDGGPSDVAAVRTAALGP